MVLAARVLATERSPRVTYALVVALGITIAAESGGLLMATPDNWRAIWAASALVPVCVVVVVAVSGWIAAVAMSRRDDGGTDRSLWVSVLGSTTVGRAALWNAHEGWRDNRARWLHEIVLPRLSSGIRDLETGQAASGSTILRGLAHDLRGNLEADQLTVLRAGGLAAALGDALVAAEAEGFRCELRVDGTGGPPPWVVVVGAWRVAQEAISNALRHSGGDRIAVRVESARDHLVVEVVDDGVGFPGTRPSQEARACGTAGHGSRRRQRGRAAMAARCLAGWSMRSLRVDKLMRVAIVDDDALFAEGLVAVLRAAGATVTGNFRGVDEALRSLSADRPEIVLVDVMLDGSPGGLDFVRRLANVGPGRPAIVVLSSFAPRHFVHVARDNGAAGYLTKDIDSETLFAALRVVASGGHVFPPPRPTLGRGPSAREIQIVACIASGLSSEETGLRLGISGRTVESHLARMFERYSVVSRTQLVVLAARKGWLPELPIVD